MSAASACVFSGVATGLSGNEAAFAAARSEHFRPRLALASELAGLDLWLTLEKGEVERLDPLAAQLFTCAFSLGFVASVRSEPCVVAGHSMGVYAALAACGALSEEDALRVVQAAHSAARTAADSGRWGMLGLVGLGAAEVEALAARHPQVRRTLHNSEISQVVSGPLAALEALEAEAREAGATHVGWLDRKVPYHHPEVLHAASDRLRVELARFAWQPPRVPLLSTLAGQGGVALRTVAELQAFTAANLSTPIDWERVVLALPALGVDTVYEAGPGFALTKIGRFIDAPLRYLNVKNLDGRSAS